MNNEGIVLEWRLHNLKTLFNDLYRYVATFACEKVWAEHAPEKYFTFWAEDAKRASPSQKTFYIVSGHVIPTDVEWEIARTRFLFPFSLLHIAISEIHNEARCSGWGLCPIYIPPRKLVRHCKIDTVPEGRKFARPAGLHLLTKIILKSTEISFTILSGLDTHIYTTRRKFLIPPLFQCLEDGTGFL